MLIYLLYKLTPISKLVCDSHCYIQYNSTNQKTPAAWLEGPGDFTFEPL